MKNRICLLVHAVVFAAALLVSPLHAQTITYTDGQDRTDSIELIADTALDVASGTATQSGRIFPAEGETFGITKTGAGTLVIVDADEDYGNELGFAAVQEGTLRLGNDYAVEYTTVSIAAGAAFDLDGRFTELDGITGAGTLDFGDGGGFYLYGAGTFAGTLTGAGNLLYSGSGAFALSGDSDFSAGELSVYSGRLVSSGNSTFGGLSLYSDFEVAGGSTVIDSYVYVSDPGSVKLAVTGGGTLEITDGLWIASYAGDSGEVAVTGAGSHLKVSEIEIAYEGAGTLTLAGGGRVTVGNGTGTLELVNGGNGTLNIGAASGGAPAAPGIVNAHAVNTHEGAGLLVFNHDATDYHFTKDGTGAGAAIRITGGTQVLVENGVTVFHGTNNTYTGGTEILGGTLVISDAGANSVLGTGDVLVGEAGTLAGNGRILGDVIIAGTLAPGDSSGLISFAGDLTLESTATLRFGLGGYERGVSFDAIDVGGDMTYAGAIVFSLVDGFTPMAGDTFDLFDFASEGAGMFGDIVFDAAGWIGDFNYATGTLTITAAAVPEPSTYALIAGLGMLGVAVWRRFRTSA